MNVPPRAAELAVLRRAYAAVQRLIDEHREFSHRIGARADLSRIEAWHDAQRVLQLLIDEVEHGRPAYLGEET